jgi:uncharacterized membrane protein YfcA
MWLSLQQSILAVLCGSLVGFTLGLIGGGGSIIATPLLLYIVGLQPHVAIGTGAFAVSANAFANLAGYAHAKCVQWRSAIVFSLVGVVGAVLGSQLGKRVDGAHLLIVFATLMIVVGALMLRRKDADRADPATAPGAGVRRDSTVRGSMLLVATAFVVGGLSGFFGIGGGFLIVPGLLFACRMPMICAIGSSLLAVGAFGLTTAVTYGLSGLVDWPVAFEYILGGYAGGLVGKMLATRLAPQKTALNRIFASTVFVVALYMLYRSASTIGW